MGGGKPKYVKSLPGVSLILAVLMVSALLLVMTNLGRTHLAYVRNSRNRENRGQAHYLAKGALEIGRLWQNVSGMGANTEDLINPPWFMETLLRDVRRAMPLQEPLWYTKADRGKCGYPWRGGRQGPVDEVENNHPCIGFTVKGRSTEADKVELAGQRYFSVPIRGTGTADTERNCRGESEESLRDSDHPCNWNRMRQGEVVEIPLYYEDDGPRSPFSGPRPKDGWHVVKADFRNAGSFLLRVRTPCRDYKDRMFHDKPMGCTKEERIVLYPQVKNDGDPYRHVEKDRVLIQWLIADADGGEEVLLAGEERQKDAANKSTQYRPNAHVQSENAQRTAIADNTQLSAGKINYARDQVWFPPHLLSDYIVLRANDMRGLLVPKIRNGGIEVNTPLIFNFINKPSITRPRFRMEYIDQAYRIDHAQTGVQLLPNHTMTREELDDGNYFVPFLEWQLLTLEPVSDSKALIEGLAIVGEGGRVESYKRQVPRSVATGFVLENP